MNNYSRSKSYLPELDGLRFFAFILVFIHHIPLPKGGVLSTLQKTGWIGVDLFFSLSAFLFTKLLITEINKAKYIDYRKFFVRRILRIWPIYLLFIAFSLLLYLYTGGAFNSNTNTRIIGLVTFTDNILTAIKGYNPLPFTSHLWTISYEEQFYLFIPFLISLLVKTSNRKKIVILIIAILSLNMARMIFIYLHSPHPSIWVLPITHFESIILGIVIGFGGFDYIFKRFNSGIIFFTGCIIFYVISLMPGVENITYFLMMTYTLIGLCTSFILYGVLNNAIISRVLSAKILVFFGKRSYGLYVYHLLGNSVALHLVNNLQDGTSKTLYTFMCSLSFTLLAAIISYHFIEKPFLKIKYRFEIIKTRPI